MNLAKLKMELAKFHRQKEWGWLTTEALAYQKIQASLEGKSTSTSRKTAKAKKKSQQDKKVLARLPVLLVAACSLTVWLVHLAH